jgi:hypothetical protein
MKSAIFFIVALFIACLVSLKITGGFLVGPGLANAQTPLHPMGATTMIKPGTIITDDGKKYEIEGGIATAFPTGFFLDWANPHGVFECQTPYKDSNGNCRDGVRLHLWNPATGERQDALQMSYPHNPIPVAAPAQEGN